MSFLSLEGLSRYTDKLKAYIDSKLGQPVSSSAHKVGDIFLSATQIETDEILECNGRSISCSSYPEYLNSVGFKFGQRGPFWRGSYPTNITYNYMSATRYDGRRMSVLVYGSSRYIYDMDWNDATGSFTWYNSSDITTDLSSSSMIFYCGTKLCYISDQEYGVLNRSGVSYTRSRVGSLSNDSVGQYDANYYGILNNGENSVILVKYGAGKISLFIFTLTGSNLTLEQHSKIYTLSSELSSSSPYPIKLGSKIYIRVTTDKSVNLQDRVICFDMIQGTLVDHIPNEVLSFFITDTLNNRGVYYKNKECTQYISCDSNDGIYNIVILSIGQDDELRLRYVNVNTKNIPLFYSSPSSIENYRNGFSAKRVNISNLYPFLLNDRLCVVGMTDNLSDAYGTASAKYVNLSVISLENDLGELAFFGESNLASNSNITYSMSMFCNQSRSQPFDGFFVQTMVSNLTVIRPALIRPDWLEAGIPNTLESLDTTLRLVGTTSSTRTFPAASCMTFIKVKEET